MNTMKINLYKSLYMSYEPNLYFAMLKCFKISLKRFLCHHSFYTIKECYEHNEDKLI